MYFSTLFPFDIFIGGELSFIHFISVLQLLSFIPYFLMYVTCMPRLTALALPSVDTCLFTAGETCVLIFQIFVLEVFISSITLYGVWRTETKADIRDN